MKDDISQKSSEKQETDEKVEKVKKKGKKKQKKHIAISEGRAYIFASFNNTIVTITDTEGKTVCSSSAGKNGFKGTKKSTPYAAQVAAEKAADAAKIIGMQRIKIFVKGVGTGREQAVRGLHAAGLEIESITDVTPIAHNGCRARKTRRV